MNRYFVYLMLSGVLLACGGGPEAPEVSEVNTVENVSYEPVMGESQNIVEVNKMKREYKLYVSESIDVGRKSPLVINLHGKNSTHEYQMKYSNMIALAEQHGFIVAFPQGLRIQTTEGDATTWDIHNDRGLKDVEYIKAIIDQVSNIYYVDSSRVYVTGFSSGGSFAYRVACELSDQIAGIASVAGAMSTSVAAACEPVKTVSVMEIHGTADMVAPVNGIEGISYSAKDAMAFWADKNGCQSEPKTTSVGEGDENSVTKTEYPGCKDNAAVVYYQLDGGGHNWPGTKFKVKDFRMGQGINADQVIWDFFSQSSTASIAESSTVEE